MKMHLNQKNIFCDWITVRQTHRTEHKPFNAGNIIRNDQVLNKTIHTTIPVQHQGLHNSSLQISSDGYTVKVSGNPSRWNRSENVHGLCLDRTKTLINQILKSIQLPPFTRGETIQYQHGSDEYTGATFSRIDMTANIATGSAGNKTAYVQHLKTQTFPKLPQHIEQNTIYFGRQSSSRTIRIYDKGKHLQEVILPITDQEPYITQLINWLNENGIIRFESEYRRYLRNNNLRLWHNATQENLSNKFMLDINHMTSKIEAPDYGDMPTPYLATLCMYIAGVDLKAKLPRNRYYNHKKVLKEYGYDIANQNIHLLQPKVKIITLEPVEMPAFYKHASGKL